MEKIITVRGTGSVSVKPDETVVSLTLRAIDKIYDKAMTKAADLQTALTGALAAVGFSANDIKTVRFNVSAEHESVRGKDGTYKNVFKGYACTHALRLAFDFDTKRLSDTLGAIASSVADPDLSIQFTVKDKTAAENALLEDAAKNAREKAEVLAAASGARLGELLSISYHFEGKDMMSRTQYGMDTLCLAKANRAAAPTVAPEDIDLTDEVSFVWTIL